MTIDRKVQATEMSCPEVRKRVKNQILSQMMTRIAKMILSLLISINSQLLYQTTK